MKRLLIVIFTIGQLHAHAQSLYGTMENWRKAPVSTDTSVDLKLPDHWYSSDSISFLVKLLYPNAMIKKQTYQTTDAHSGAFAVKLVTVNDDILGVSSTLFTNSKVLLDLSAIKPGQSFADAVVLDGGTPVDDRVASISAWVKYQPVGNDSAEIYVAAVLENQGSNGDDSIVGEGSLKLGACPIYTQVDVPVTYIKNTPKPNLLRIIITSSSDAPEENSILYVDDINMKTTGIGNVKKAALVLLYPNPADNYVKFQGLNKDEAISIDLFSENGQRIATRMLTSEESCVFSGLPSGNYYYEAVSNMNNERQSGKFIIMK